MYAFFGARVYMPMNSYNILTFDCHIMTIKCEFCYVYNVKIVPRCCMQFILLSRLGRVRKPDNTTCKIWPYNLVMLMVSRF